MSIQGNEALDFVFASPGTQFDNDFNANFDDDFYRQDEMGMSDAWWRALLVTTPPASIAPLAADPNDFRHPLVPCLAGILLDDHGHKIILAAKECKQ